MSSKPLGTRQQQAPHSLPPKPDPKSKPKSQNLKVADKASGLSDEDTSDDTPATPTTPVIKKVLVKKPPVPAKPINLKPFETKTIPKPLYRANRPIPKASTEATPTSTTMRRTLSTPIAPNVPSRPTARPVKAPATKPPAAPVRRSTTSIPPATRAEPKITPEKRILLLSQQIKEKAARVEALETLLKEAEETSASLEEELIKAKAEKELILKEKADAHIASEGQLLSISAEFLAKLAEKDFQLKELEDQLLDSQFQVGSLAEEHNDELAQLKQQLHSSTQELEQQNVRIQELLGMQEVAEARTVELASLKAELKAAQEAHQNFMESSEQISGQLGCQIAGYQQQLFDIRGNKNSSNHEIEELRQHMEKKLQEEMDRTKACQAKAATFERAIFDLRAQLDLSASSTQLKETLNLKDQLETKLANKEQCILESQDKINELQALILVLEDKLAHSPTQEQLEELTFTLTHLEAKLAQEKLLKDESLEKAISLQNSIVDLQYKLEYTSTKYHETEQMCDVLTKKLDAALESLTESQTKAAAFEHTILDLEAKLADVQSSNQIQEAAKDNYDPEHQLKSEFQSAIELQNKIASQDDIISTLEAKLKASQSQFKEMSAIKDTLESSFAMETLLVKEKQEHIRALQASLDTTPTLAQVQALEEAKLILAKELAIATEKSQEKILLLESEIIALKQELALVQSFSQTSPLKPAIEDISAIPSTEAEPKSMHDNSASFSYIEAELNECRGKLENAQKEIVVARQLIETLKASSNNITQDPTCDNPKQIKQFWDAREKELLFTIASLAAELEDYKYSASSQNKQLQATCDAAIAHSKKLAYELSEAKHSSAHKISVLNAGKKLLHQELQAQETLNFELMRELEGQKICQPPEY